MGQDFRSANWYRVATVRPRLAPHVEVQRQVQRGVTWYVLFDPINQRTHRLTPQAWHLVSRMDGQRTVDTLWQDSAAALGESAPPQDDVIQLMAQLHEADILVSDAMPDLDELLRRRDQKRHERWKANLLNPLSIRLRLWDPDAFLTRTLPWVRWLFGPAGMLLWLALTIPAAIQAVMHWHELTSNFSDQLLSATSLVTLVLVYPVVKALHEMAHAYAAKAGGAAVHDMGLMFLIFAPVPYVDASGTTAFASKRRRALVAAAGMLMELALSALALYVWLVVEPGMVRSIAYTVMVVGGVSTVLFNGNPLLRYDGYFVFSDWIETPNLAQRANQYWQWLIRHHVFGLTQAQAPRSTRGERVWFSLYAPASLAYRIGLTVSIALFLGKEYLYVGLGVGLWGLVTLVVWPLLKGLRYVLASTELTGRRARPLAATALFCATALVLLLVVPAPVSTYAQGTVWPAEQAQIRAHSPGFVEQIALRSGQAVQAGHVALLLRNDQLEANLDAAVARGDRHQRAYIALLSGKQEETDVSRERVAMEVQRQEWQRAQDELAHAQDKVDRLAIPVQRDGRLELPREEDLPGRWFKQGELIGHVVTQDAPTIRVVVTQDDIELVRARLARIEVRLAGDIAHVWPARMVREVPAGEDELPSQALALEGGGLIPVDGRDPNHPKSLNRVFQFDLILPKEALGAQIGERAHVRFEHEAEPIGQQLGRRIRQLVLSHLTL
jgi:putative peptide zinc metalloprotease protein